jgi:hypothetical protein
VSLRDGWDFRKCCFQLARAIKTDAPEATRAKILHWADEFWAMHRRRFKGHDRGEVAAEVFAGMEYVRVRLNESPLAVAEERAVAAMGAPPDGLSGLAPTLAFAALLVRELCRASPSGIAPLSGDLLIERMRDRGLTDAKTGEMGRTYLKGLAGMGLIRKAKQGGGNRANQWEWIGDNR